MFAIRLEKGVKVVRVFCFIMFYLGGVMVTDGCGVCWVSVLSEKVRSSYVVVFFSSVVRDGGFVRGVKVYRLWGYLYLYYIHCL